MNLLPLSIISIEAERQRPTTPDKVAELADSIEKLGILQPIVVERRDATIFLRAGLHRIRAVDLLHSQGITVRHGHQILPLGTIPIVNFPDLDPLTAFDIELEENLIRNPLTWQERAAAFARRHALTLSHGKPEGREAVRETLAAMQKVDPATIKSGLNDAHQAILVGNALSDPEIAKAKTHKEAVKILSRKFRKAQDAERVCDLPQIFLGDALETLRTFPDAHFDAVISDPPYGIGITQLSYQNSSEQKYDDSYESWGPLVRGLFIELGRVLSADSHGYLFCAFERFDELAAVAAGAGFETFPRPLIWDRSPDGRLTTPEKWPRRCYECILYFRRGNRPLYEVRGDVLRYPADRDEGNYHGAKKPVELIADLMERSTRPAERIVDPFAGSGSVARAGKLLSREVWSIEGDPAYFGLMNKLLEKEDDAF